MIRVFDSIVGFCSCSERRQLMVNVATLWLSQPGRTPALKPTQATLLYDDEYSIISLQRCLATQILRSMETHRWASY
jgi:hypothetical protein